jgi:non-specific serine/threonine protein kinase
MRPSKQLAELLMEQLQVATDERESFIRFARGGELTKSILTVEPRDNLPIQLTSFIGREKEIAEIKNLVADNRLVTLTGAGGTGKTRLSLQVSAQLLDEFKDGVWLIDLAPYTDPLLVQQAIAVTLRVHEQPGRSFLDILKDYLAKKNMLLLLDNCEHLIEACAQVADALLHAAPQIKILTTSREALGITGETTFAVRPLSLPTKSALSVEAVSQYEAVHLFIDRAVAVQNDFRVTNDNAPSVTQICRRLDGIPLAIELAAARVKGLSIEKIASRLNDRFRLLTGGNRTALPRQRTLQAAIDWSYKLLSDKERKLLRRLAVFAGGLTMEAAESICVDEALEPGEILDLLLHLVDKSLVVAETQASEPRYHMLETIRQYAREKLDEAGEAVQVRGRHLEYFMAWVEEVEPRLRGPEQIVWWDRIETEHENIRSALEWSLNGGDAQFGLRLAGAMYWYWGFRGYTTEEVRALQALLETTGPEMRTRWRAKALSELNILLRDRGEYVAGKAAMQEALGIWRELGDNWWISSALADSGWVSLYERDVDTALALFREAVDLANTVDDKWMLANALKGLGVAIGRSDHTAAQPVLEASIAIWRAIGDKVGLADTLHDMGSVAHGQKDYERAARLSEESLALFQQAGDIGNISMMLINFGFILQRQGNHAKATRFIIEGLSLALERGYRSEIASSFVALGGVAAGQNDPERAAQLLGAAETIFKEIGLDISIWPHRLADYKDWAAAARAQLGEETFAAAFAAGRAMTQEQANKLALETTNE